MKLKELFEQSSDPESPNLAMDPDDMLRILLSMDQKEEWITWNPDGSVSLDSNLFIYDDDLTPNGELPIHFHQINGDVKCVDGSDKLKTLKNFPKIVRGCVDLAHCKNLESLEGCPVSITKYFQIYDAPKVTSLKGLDLRYFGGDEIMLEFDNVTSLVGIEKFLHMSASNKPFTFYFDFNKVTEGGIGLVLVKNLKEIKAKLGGEIFEEPFKIIEKYIGKPEDFYECQAELLEQGFEEFAKL